MEVRPTLTEGGTAPDVNVKKKERSQRGLLAQCVCLCGPDKHSCVTRRASAAFLFLYRGFAVAARPPACGRRLWNKGVNPLRR